MNTIYKLDKNRQARTTGPRLSVVSIWKMYCCRIWLLPELGLPVERTSNNRSILYLIGLVLSRLFLLQLQDIECMSIRWFLILWSFGIKETPDAHD